MSKCPFFYERIFKRETLKRRRFRDVNSERIWLSENRLHWLCFLPLAANWCKFCEAVAFRNHREVLSARLRGHCSGTVQFQEPVLNPSRSTVQSLFLFICETGPFQRHRDREFETVPDAERFKNVTLSGSFPPSAAFVITNFWNVERSLFCLCMIACPPRKDT